MTKVVFRRTGILALVAVIGLAATASASPWSNSAGSTTSFSWSNGANANDLYGSPLVISDTFIFSPTTYSAQAAGTDPNGDPVTVQKGDVMSVDVVMNPGLFVDQILIQVVGNYDLQGESSVEATGAIDIQDNLSPNTANAPLVFDHAFPVTSPPNSSDNFQGLGVLDLSSMFPGISDVHIEISTELITISNESGAVASMALTGQAFQVQVTNIPEPATASFLALAGLALLRRRR